MPNNDAMAVSIGIGGWTGLSGNESRQGRLDGIPPPAGLHACRGEGVAARLF
jgi:hypothetical protein